MLIKKTKRRLTDYKNLAKADDCIPLAGGFKSQLPASLISFPF